MSAKVLKEIYIPDKCNFETNRHHVSELIAKIPKNVKTEALLSKLENLAKSTFDTRELYEEDAIEMHLARKRVRVPKEYQEELDLLALRGRRENQQVGSLPLGLYYVSKC